jgi:hypothetical protein
MTYKLLDQFPELFAGKAYLHRISNQGDIVASYLFEDLYDLGRSKKFCDTVQKQERVANIKTSKSGKTKRTWRRDFWGESSTAAAVLPPGLSVAIGDVATIEIGTEVKILAKAMIKQLDRVGTGWMTKPRNSARTAISYLCWNLGRELRSLFTPAMKQPKVWPTDGKTYRILFRRLPTQSVVLWRALSLQYDEILVLRFRATKRSAL